MIFFNLTEHQIFMSCLMLLYVSSLIFFLAGGLSDRSQWITYKKLFGSEFIDTLMKEWSSDTQQKQ